MKSINNQLAEIKQLIPSFENKNDKVSKVSVGWQIDHSLRVMNSIILALEQSDETEYKSKFNFWRTLFLALSFLPRGKGRSPKSVMPEELVLEDDLHRRLSYAFDNVEKLKSLKEHSHFPHPVFGMLKRNEAEKFIRIHTEHHLKIIRDILAR